VETGVGGKEGTGEKRKSRGFGREVHIKRKDSESFKNLTEKKGRGVTKREGENNGMGSLT